MNKPPSAPFGLPATIYYGWIIVGATTVTNLMLAPVSPVIFAFFLEPMSHDLGWSRSTIAWAFTVRLLMSGITGPVIGALIDRFGARWLGAFAALVAGAALIAIPFSHQLWLFYLVFAVAGAVGLGGPGGALLTSVPIAKWFVAKRGTAMAIAVTGMPAGVVIGIPIAQWLIQSIGWRGAWILFGAAICIIAAPLSALFIRRVPQDLGLQPDGVTTSSDPEVNSKPAPDSPKEEDWTLAQALRTPALWLLLGSAALAGIALTGTLLYRISFWQATGMSPALVAFGTVSDPFTVIFSALAFGVMSDRVPPRYLGMIGVGGFGLSMLPMIFSTGQPFTIFAHNITWGLAAGAHITVNNLIWPNYYGRRALGSIRGVALPVSIAASGLGPPLFGYLLDAKIPFPIVWSVSLGLFFTAGILYFFAKQPKLQAVPSKELLNIRQRVP